MPSAELSEYERKRQETISKNQALFRSLALEAASTGLAPSSASARASSTGGAGSSSSKRPPRLKPRPKPEAAAVPARKSSRLLGLEADSAAAKRKADDEQDALREAERAKRQRVAGDLRLADIVTGGRWDRIGGSEFLTGVGLARRALRHEDGDGDGDGETGDGEIAALRERLGRLELWGGAVPARIRITPERVYAVGFHPTRDKALVFAGDKMGNLGLLDASQTAFSANGVKKELDDDDDDDDDDDEEFEPAITTFKLHARTICAFQFAPDDANALYSASYDSSIRKLDLAKGVAVEVYAPSEDGIDEPISGVQVVDSDPHVLYFSTLDGLFGMHDLRTDGSSSSSSPTQSFRLSEKKIGGFGLHPTAPHLVATASLDRTLKIWDLRMVTGQGADRIPALLGVHTSRLSVSAACWNERGQVATSSYDDTVKIYDFSSSCAGGDWKAGVEMDERLMEPSAIVPHNNQTGRWVTILKPQWQAQPQDGIQRFVIGNMNRFVDIYASTGQQLAQLGGGDLVTAVPAAAQFHPSMDWVAAGTASGKLCLWM